MRIKLTALLLTIGLLFSMTGCGENTGNQGDSSSTESVINYEVVPVPEGGWTREELARTIRFNGVPIELPFTAKSLSDKFKLEVGSWHENSATIEVYHNENLIAGLGVDGVPEMHNSESAMMASVVRHIATVAFVEPTNRVVTINNVSLDATEEYIRNVLGEPSEVEGDDKENCKLIYNDKNTKEEILRISVIEGNAFTMLFNLIGD